MRVAAVLLLGLAVCALPARAEGPEPAPGPSLLARLGTPARPEVVEALLASPQALDTDAAVRVAHALGHAGGWGAVPGVVRLLDHAAEEARLAALEAAARIDLRSESLARPLRRFAREASEREVRAAVEALGHVGDGRDVPLLLELTGIADARTRAAAFRALEQLTGAQVPLVTARWAWYWRQFRARANLLLPQVVVALRDAVDGPDRQALADLVRRYGWVDVPGVRETLAEWIVAPDRDLRAIACTLVAELRLADLAPSVEECLRYAGTREHREIARAALEALGYRAEETLLQEDAAPLSTPGD